VLAHRQGLRPRHTSHSRQRECELQQRCLDACSPCPPQNIFVTGRHTGYAGFDDRLRRSVQATQSTDIRVRVQRARDPRFDAWRGMALWSVSDEARHSAISRADYDEKGSDYLSEHSFSAALV